MHNNNGSALKKVENFLKNVRVEFFDLCASQIDWVGVSSQIWASDLFFYYLESIRIWVDIIFKIFIVMKPHKSRNKESFCVHSFLMTPLKNLNEPNIKIHAPTQLSNVQQIKKLGVIHHNFKLNKTNPLIVQSNWPSSKNFFQINLSTKKYCMLHVKKNWHVILKLARSLSADLFKFNFFVKRDDCSINRRFLVEFSLVRQRDCVG